MLLQFHLCTAKAVDRLAARSFPGGEVSLADPTTTGRYVNDTTSIIGEILPQFSALEVTTDALTLSKRAVGPGVESCWSASDTSASLIAQFRADCEPLITAYKSNPLGRIDLGYQGTWSDGRGSCRLIVRNQNRCTSWRRMSSLDTAWIMRQQLNQCSWGGWGKFQHMSAVYGDVITFIYPSWYPYPGYTASCT